MPHVQIARITLATCPPRCQGRCRNFGVFVGHRSPYAVIFGIFLCSGPKYQNLVILAILTLATSPLKNPGPCHNFGISLWPQVHAFVAPVPKLRYPIRYLLSYHFSVYSGSSTLKLGTQRTGFFILF